MGRTKKPPKCQIKGCSKDCTSRTDGNRRKSYRKFCSTHYNNGTIARFLNKLYNDMNRRVKGEGSHNRGNWKGKSILPRDVFTQWAKNHPDFLSLYKRYVMNDFDLRLAPSINRIDSNKGYTLDNMEWMTFSQNSSLAGTVRKNNNIERKIIYQVLGVK